MASIPGAQFNITGASGSQGLLGPKSSWRAYVFPRGGYASQDSTGTLITFDSAAVASRFAANNWLQSGLSTANIRQVSAVGGNSIAISGAALTVTTNDRIYLVGNTQPTVTGGSATYTIPASIIRQRDDDAATLYTNSMVTSNSDGLVQFFSQPALYDVLIQDGNQSNQGSIIDLPVGAVEGVSTSFVSVFGVTVTMHAALGVTGTLAVGATATFSSSISGTTLTAVTIRSQVEPVYNVMHPTFGATGDGATDDTAAIQAAIDAAELTGGIVYFPVPSVDYLFTTLTVQVAGIALVGGDQVNTVLRSSSTTGTAILFDKSKCRIENLVIESTAARTAIAATVYADGTPTAGKHGIAFIPSNQAITQAACVIRNVTVNGHPDDGIICEQPELLVMENVDSGTNGRFGIHLNGQANSKGISNKLTNCRSITSGGHGIFVRTILHSVLENCQSLQGNGTRQIYIHGGRNIKLIEPDVEDSSSNANTGIELTGDRHEILGGLIIAFQTPIKLATGRRCKIDSPLVANTGFTAADQVVSIDNASTYNLLRIGPLSFHSNVTALTNAYTSWALAVGNRIEPVPNSTFAFAAGDLTPSVNAWSGPYRTANTSGTTITNFDNGVVSQVIRIIVGDTWTTFDFTGTSLFGNAGVDYTAGRSDSLTCVSDGTNWYCDVSNN